jgi:glutathione-regulated potassium-efflux system ancillary protein KefG
MPKTKILILFAHPLFEKSVVNQALVKAIPDDADITFHDLYEMYPEFDVDIRKEQKILSEHDIIIWHHPMYWYSCPPLLKQWIDMVLEYGWAYGKSGNQLQGKHIFQVITTGGKKENYCVEGRDRYTMMELLEPFNQTAKVCGMVYLPPYVIHGTHAISDTEIEIEAKKFHQLLKYLLSVDLKNENFNPYNYLNDWFDKTLKNG